MSEKGTNCSFVMDDMDLTFRPTAKNTMETSFSKAEEMSRKHSQANSHAEDQISIQEITESAEDSVEGTENVKVSPLKFFLSMLAIAASVGLGVIGMEIAGYVLHSFFEMLEDPQSLFLPNIITPLIGAKGNIEMTMSSRIGTLIHKNKFRSWKQQLKYSSANIGAVHVQGICVGVLLSCINILINFPKMQNDDMVYSCTIVTLTCAIAPVLISFFLILLSIGLAKFKIDPDTILSPLAALSGDAITVTTMSLIKSLVTLELALTFRFQTIFTIYMLGTLILALIAAFSTKATRKALFPGSASIVIALMISYISGYIFTLSVKRLQAISLVQGLVNGIPGTMGSIYISMLSSHYGTVPKTQMPRKSLAFKYLKNPLKMFSLSPARNVIQTLNSTMFICFLLFSSSSLMFMNMMIEAIKLIEDYILFETWVAIGINAFTLLWIVSFVSVIFAANCWPLDTYLIPLITALGDLLGAVLVYLILNLNGVDAKGFLTTVSYQNLTQI
uniref:MgtE domain-containing protein n=1 Tax=Rhabditophanes sp. KR3021 TaxID=114890 RepID=A0AC35U3Y8_9BILA